MTNLLLVVPFVVGLLVLLGPGRRGKSQFAGALGRHQQRAGRWRRRGLAAGLAAAVLLMFGQRLEWLAAPVFGVCVLAGVLVGELSVSRPDGAVRTAMLRPRRVRDYLPRRYGPLLGTLVLVLTALLTVFTVVANSLPGAGNGLARLSCSTGVVNLISRGDLLYVVLSPLVSVVGGAGLCLLVVRKIVNRPAFPADQAPDTVDNALRTASAEAVTLAWGCLVASSLLATARSVGFLVDTVGSPWCNGSWLMPARVAVYLLLAGSVGVLIYFLIRLTRLSGPREAAE